MTPPSGASGRAGLLLVLATLVGCATTPGPSSSADDAIAGIMATPPLDQLHWGLLVVDAVTGRTLHDLNGARKFIPASNAKVLVTAAALREWGPDHRYRTALRAAGRLENGVLDGDLVLVGTGDPTLSERFWPSDEAPLEALADSLRAAGVREVRGALVVDASAWDSTTVAGTWMSANLPGTASATGGAFAVAEGLTSITVRGAARPGEPAEVHWEPLGDSSFVRAHVETVPPNGPERLDVAYLPESRRLHVTGTIPADSVRRERVPTRDPVRQASAALHRVLSARGIPVAGGWTVAWDEGRLLGGGCSTGGLASCPGAAVLAGLDSPPLMEIVRGILEPSQNWMAEQVVRTLGASDSTRAGWDSGLRVMDAILVDDLGVDPLDVSLRDGSGLSAYSLVTPRALVRIFRWAREQPWGEAYRRALAEPGEDSTLEHRLTGLEGRLFAKTGTISNVNSLSGYLVADGGRELVFSLLTNGSGRPAEEVRSAMDRVVRTLARSY